ncbi:MAG: helix-turn-helix domain-containing protein, partial [Nitrospirae bacterium]|nr:helix-turn-helix domain-containing protein [Nitrospirota bacterium]
MTIDFYSQFGRLVRAHRCRNRLTQQQLSKRLKMSRASIANIELGRQKIPLHQWFALADALKTDPIDLLPLAVRKEE